MQSGYENCIWSSCQSQAWRPHRKNCLYGTPAKLALPCRSQPRPSFTFSHPTNLTLFSAYNLIATTFHRRPVPCGSSFTLPLSVALRAFLTSDTWARLPLRIHLVSHTSLPQPHHALVCPCPGVRPITPRHCAITILPHHHLTSCCDKSIACLSSV